MKPNDFVRTQIEIMRLAQAVEGLDLNGFIATLANFDKLDPRPEVILFARAEENINAVRSLSYCLLEVQEANRLLRESMNVTTMLDWNRKIFAERLKEIAYDFEIEESLATAKIYVHVIPEVAKNAEDFCRLYFDSKAIKYEIVGDLEEYKARAGLIRELRDI